MLVCSQCIPCYLKQAHNTLSRTALSDREISEVLQKLCGEIPKLDPNKSPAENSSYLLHKVSELAGVRDPFDEDKAQSNAQAMQLWPELRRLINEAEDPLFTALKIAAAGNVVDLGILDGYDLKESVRQVLETDFARNDYRKLKEKMPGDLLYIGDNSGEIAFDRLLVEELVGRGCKVTYVVKEGPILNDATRVDAAAVEMGMLADVITTGSNLLGVIPGHLSQEFLRALDKARCVLAKGQANYESLEDQSGIAGKTFFCLKAKCGVIAEHLGVKLGDMVLAHK